MRFRQAAPASRTTWPYILLYIASAKSACERAAAPGAGWWWWRRGVLERPGVLMSCAVPRTCSWLVLLARTPSARP